MIYIFILFVAAKWDMSWFPIHINIGAKWFKGFRWKMLLKGRNISYICIYKSTNFILTNINTEIQLDGCYYLQNDLKDVKNTLEEIHRQLIKFFFSNLSRTTASSVLLFAFAHINADITKRTFRYFGVFQWPFTPLSPYTKKKSQVICVLSNM